MKYFDTEILKTSLGSKNSPLNHTFLSLVKLPDYYINTFLVVGDSHEYNDNLREEHDKYKDILQLNFTDAYRNMTYKHLAAYWWVANQCGENVQYVLKTDDDQAVDVHHLQLFMEMFILPKKLQNFYLCHYLEEQVPRRDPDNKWHVSRNEYESDSYPNFCSGWAYVTNINTLSKVLGTKSKIGSFPCLRFLQFNLLCFYSTTFLPPIQCQIRLDSSPSIKIFFLFSEASHHQPYFWIDDLWVTGHLVEQLQIPVHIFNWKNNFLSEHIQAKDDLLKGKMFTPELMVASDLEPGEIRHLASKFDKCHKKQCYNQVYDSQELKEYMRPPMTIRRPAGSSMKTEL